MIGITNSKTQIKVNYDFASASWSDIIRLSKSGQAKNYFKLGDTKEMKDNNGKDMIITIIAFDCDSYLDSSKAAITFGVKYTETQYFSLLSIPTYEELMVTMPESISIQPIIKEGSEFKVFYFTEDDFYSYTMETVFDDPNTTYFLRDGNVFDNGDIHEPTWLGDHAQSAAITFGFCV